MTLNTHKTAKVLSYYLIPEIAAIVFVLYFTGTITGIFVIILVIFAVIFVLTSLVGTCPLYLPFGLSTLRKKLSK